MVKALVAKGLDGGVPSVSSVNEPDQDILHGSLANIVKQVVGQDATRLMNVDNSQRTLDQHMLLRFYDGDVIYVNIRLKTPDVYTGILNQLVSDLALENMYTEENFTLKITLGQTEDPNILYSDTAKTIVSGYNKTINGSVTIPSRVTSIAASAFMGQAPWTIAAKGLD